VATNRYRLIDSAGSELFIVDLDPADVVEDRSIDLPDGSSGPIVEIYDDEDGREGDVAATLVVDVA
jgi:hypothetical protein